MSCNMRDAHRSIELISKGQLFKADRLGVVVYIWDDPDHPVSGKWYRPSEVPEAFGLKRVEKKPEQMKLL